MKTRRTNPGRFVPLTVFLASAGVTLAGSERLSAQSPTVRAYLEQPEIGLGQPVELIIELSGVQDRSSVRVPAALGLPATSIDGFDRTSIWRMRPGPEEGVFTVRYTVFRAPPPGSHRIGPLRVAADGVVLETESLTLVVAGGSDASVRARVDPASVKVGDTFELIVEVIGDGRLTHFPEVPDVYDFAEAEGRSGGSDDRFRHTLRAIAAGVFEVPPIEVRLDQGVLQTDAVRLVVTDEPPRVDARAVLDSELVWVGSEFVVTLDVDGVRELDAEPVLPDTDTFAVLVASEPPSGPRFRTPGERQSTHWDFRYRAVSAGRFEFGPVQIAANGRTYMTESIDIVVDALPNMDLRPPGDLRLEVTSDALPVRRSVYVNQPLILSYRVLHRQQRMGGLQTGTVSWPAFEGFLAVDLSRPRTGGEAVTVEGRRYSAIPLRRVALIPASEGDVEIGPAAVEVRLPERRFGFRGQPAPNRGSTSVVLTSDPVTLEVLPLPEEDRPADFTGHVGTLEVTSWVDRTSVPAGDTVTVAVDVSVEGYVAGLPDPEVRFPAGFEVAPPRMQYGMSRGRDGLSGTRSYTYRLVAVAPGTYEIPAVVMSFFDPETGAYGVSRGQPFTITVVSAGEEVR